MTAGHTHHLSLHHPLPPRKHRLRTNLLKWYTENARPLPWRTNPSPYTTLVSEIMCQQTQIKTVLPYYERWTRAFPDFAALANASVDEVMRLWSGLGYYSRGRKLLEAAKYVQDKGLPTDEQAWLLVPGVGAYTAGAIAR
jgi:A/G-specific adenine glycosylase